ncbi:MAG: hypothetical protein Tsb0013_12100 [Phycisphaerales bacterium]
MTTTPRRPARSLARTLIGGTLLLSLSAGALAQGANLPGSGQDSGAAQRPPRVDGVDKAKTLLHYAVGVGVIALCVGVVVIPGRRDHDE